MRIALAVAISLGIVGGLSTTHAVESFSKHEESPSKELSADTAHQIAAQGESSVGATQALQQNTAPDCEGKSPSRNHAATLLSRFIRSSTMGRGVQCPIPPVPGQSTEQELHP